MERRRAMAESLASGAWVEIRAVILPAGTRAPQVPEDTQTLPLEMRVRGFLVSSARLGDVVEIETRAGRRLRGTLVASNPEYAHGFGTPVPQLAPIAGEVREILRARGRWR